MKPLILDSALGTELEKRGEYLPSFKTSIWSAYSLIHNPEAIKQIHIDNIEAGADVITTSNYQATPELLKREPSAPPYEDLAKRALELCKEAIIKTGANTKIAGCYPPIHVTFRPDLSSKEKTLRKFYETLGTIYQDEVDVIICETMASIYEGTIAASTAKKFSDKVWLSWTTRGNKLNRLPSTELLDLAISEGLKLDIDCQLVNCVHADTASMAIEKLKKEKSFGIYANSSIYKKNKLEGFVSDSDEWHYHNHQPISSVEYKDFVVGWVENGASVIGGCCRTTTEHIKEIKKIIEKNMNWFLILGAIISLVGMFFHGLAGQTKYMGNIYKSEMEPLTKSLSLVSWHVFTIFLFISALTLFYTAYNPNLAMAVYPIIV